MFGNGFRMIEYELEMKNGNVDQSLKNVIWNTSWWLKTDEIWILNKRIEFYK